jgi:Bacterial regulatory proteins, tetR family
MFREKGTAVSLADVTKAAGFSHGGFYKHFASKEDLVDEATFHAFNEPGSHSAVALEGRRDRRRILRTGGVSPRSAGFGLPPPVNLIGPLVTALDERPRAIGDFGMAASALYADGDVFYASRPIVVTNPIVDGEGQFVAVVVRPHPKRFARSQPPILSKRLEPHDKPAVRAVAYVHNSHGGTLACNRI